jgi:hypothetical protein
MFKRTLLLLFTLPALIFADAINEFQWIDENNWSIELLDTGFGLFSMCKNCTTDVIKLYIASSKNVFNFVVFQ